MNQRFRTRGGSVKDRKNYNPNHPDIQISRPDFMANVELPPNVKIIRGWHTSDPPSFRLMAELWRDKPEIITDEELGRK